MIPVFDVGGVFLDWNPRHLYRKLIADEAALEEFLATVCTPEWNRMQDAGRPWDEAVAELVARHPGQAALIEAYHARWEEMVPRVFEGTVAILRELKARGPVYAITNFSEEKFRRAQRLWPFLAEFDGIVVSGEARLLKPDPAIYRRLLDAFGLRAADCVFIDDLPENVAGAEAVGMRGLLFVGPDRLRRDLAALGML